MKIKSVILTIDDPLYNHFDNIKRKYLDSLNEDYLFLYNGTDNSLNNSRNRTMNYYSEVMCTQPYMLLKFMKLINDGLLDGYDFIVRMNSSTFVNLNVIRDLLENRRDNVYMGYRAGHMISGACAIFSKDVISLIKANQHLLNYSSPDDIAIGDLLKTLQVPMTDIGRAALHELSVPPGLHQVREAIKQSHIRIRNDYDRNIDKNIWSMIEGILNL